MERARTRTERGLGGRRSGIGTQRATGPARYRGRGSGTPDGRAAGDGAVGRRAPAHARGSRERSSIRCMADLTGAFCPAGAGAAVSATSDE